ncbi:methyl-accepting chemotaxis protein [Caldanaerovirga acetigignens]|uniref:Methyl-accepting chemotaxis protein n=1 Tax=Caldanaerovirga acetigignens TaxID=447595 RepID=A0A1M7I4P2_9FIRM|nr:methyl-accepting chemotaxis protein [Caldanaerovirga acetigignens]SHM35761.1 methyl-accepting chemotaxis protein [Caldanaerovirga acetigignens]
MKWLKFSERLGKLNFLSSAFRSFSISKKTKHSLKTRLVVYLIIMALLPLIVLSGIINLFIKSSMESEVKEKTSLIVSSLNDNIDIFINENKNLVSFLASTNIVRSMERYAIETFIYDMLSRYPQISRVFIADTQGNVFGIPYSSLSEETNVLSESWYTGAINQKDVYITKTRLDPASGSMIISMSSPIFSDKGEIKGVLSADISLVSLTSIISKLKVGTSGYAFITDSDGNVIGHKDYKIVRSRENYMKYDFVKQALSGKIGFITFSENGNKIFVAYGSQPATGWGIFVSQPVSEAYSNIYKVTRVFTLIGLFTVIISVAAGLYIGSRISSPILKMVTVSSQVSTGDLTETIDIRDSSEIGFLASSFNSMITGLKNLVIEIKKTAEELSTATKSQAEYAENSKKAAEQISTAMEQIAAGASDQSQKLSEISDVINDLVISNGKIDDNARSTAQAAEEMLKRAKNGQVKMNEANSSMDSIKYSVDQSKNIIVDLDASVKEIGKISDIIKDIVEQTNLLALNASIEAARAGESGRGFAVVAQEIRKLAEKSGQAAKQISDIVRQIQENSQIAVESMGKSSREVESGTQIIADANETFNRLISDIEATATAARQISEEISTQYINIERIVNKITDITSVSQETAAASEEVTASTQEQTAAMENIAFFARKLAELAENLSSAVSKFKV